jgi:hypothetical protein
VEPRSGPPRSRSATRPTDHGKNRNVLMPASSVSWEKRRPTEAASGSMIVQLGRTSSRCSRNSLRESVDGHSNRPAAVASSPDISLFGHGHAVKEPRDGRWGPRLTPPAASDPTRSQVDTSSRWPARSWTERLDSAPQTPDGMRLSGEGLRRAVRCRTHDEPFTTTFGLETRPQSGIRVNPLEVPARLAVGECSIRWFHSAHAETSGTTPTMKALQPHADTRHRWFPLSEWPFPECPHVAQ